MIYNGDFYSSVGTTANNGWDGEVVTLSFNFTEMMVFGFR